MNTALLKADVDELVTAINEGIESGICHNFDPEEHFMKLKAKH